MAEKHVNQQIGWTFCGAKQIPYQISRKLNEFAICTRAWPVDLNARVKNFKWITSKIFDCTTQSR